jgi:hypothetical protein
MIFFCRFSRRKNSLCWWKKIYFVPLHKLDKFKEKIHLKFSLRNFFCIDNHFLYVIIFVKTTSVLHFFVPFFSFVLSLVCLNLFMSLRDLWWVNFKIYTKFYELSYQCCIAIDSRGSKCSEISNKTFEQKKNFIQIAK